jgi:hypothetical protein
MERPMKFSRIPAFGLTAILLLGAAVLITALSM